MNIDLIPSFHIRFKRRKKCLLLIEVTGDPRLDKACKIESLSVLLRRYELSSSYPLRRKKEKDKKIISLLERMIEERY